MKLIILLYTLLFRGMVRRSVEFANTDDATEFVTFANEVSVQADGWGQLSPFGDFPGKGVIKNADGTVKEFSAVQRMDRQAAEGMVEKFRSPWNRVKRYITGCWILNGHPDMANARNKYPDKSPKGMIADLEVREDGLYCLPVFTDEGKAMVEQKKLFFSGRWDSNPLPEENGKKVFQPNQLKSVGLTDCPNLPVHFLNDKPSNQPTTTAEDNMLKSLLLPILALHGVTFANDATDQQIADACKTLGDKAKTADTLTAEKANFANEKTSLTQSLTLKETAIGTLTSERDTARTNFANERKERIKGALDAAIVEGRITAAERPTWETRLGNEVNFANELTALAGTGKQLKTLSVTANAGERKVEIANASDRTAAVRTLVNEEMKINGGQYDAAYATVQKKNPALFEAMKQPKKD